MAATVPHPRHVHVEAGVGTGELKKKETTVRTRLPRPLPPTWNTPTVCCPSSRLTDRDMLKLLTIFATQRTVKRNLYSFGDVASESWGRRVPTVQDVKPVESDLVQFSREDASVYESSVRCREQEQDAEAGGAHRTSARVGHPDALERNFCPTAGSTLRRRGTAGLDMHETFFRPEDGRAARLSIDRRGFAGGAAAVWGQRSASGVDGSTYRVHFGDKRRNKICTRALFF